MATVSIIRHNPIAIFSGTTEVVITYDDKSVVRHVEPSGNVGTQYPKELGAQWFGTIENLNRGLVKGGVTWGDVYKTDVLWTTPSPDKEACGAYRDAFNAVYAPMIRSFTGCELKSNRMARFTDPEGFPDPKALFEVQIKAVRGEGVTVKGGSIAYPEWTDVQPSGASVQHKNAKGDTVTTLGDDAKAEMEFVLVEQYEKKLKDQGVDFRKDTLWLEVLVARDLDPAKTWSRIDAIKAVVASYFGDHRPAGMIYPVSRIPNLDGIVEPEPRCIVGKDVKILRSGTIEHGFSTWAAFDRSGVREVMVSGIPGSEAGAILRAIDSRVKAAGGRGLRENGVFNNAYVVSAGSTKASRDRLAAFNPSFAAFYEGTAPAGRTAQFVPGFAEEGAVCAIASRSIFAL
jgi:hypothetical protein